MHNGPDDGVRLCDLSRCGKGRVAVRKVSHVENRNWTVATLKRSGAGTKAGFPHLQLHSVPARGLSMTLHVAVSKLRKIKCRAAFKALSRISCGVAGGMW